MKAKAVAPKAKRAKVETKPPHASHKANTKGVCTRCNRVSADLAPPCPGYITAADVERKGKQ